MDRSHFACKHPRGASGNVPSLCAHVSDLLDRGLMATSSYITLIVPYHRKVTMTVRLRESQFSGWNSLFRRRLHIIITHTRANLMLHGWLGSMICFMNFGSHDPIVLYWIPCNTEPCYEGSLLYLMSNTLESAFWSLKPFQGFSKKTILLHFAEVCFAGILHLW